MHLNDRELDILSAIRLDSRRSTLEVARNIGRKLHSVRYSLNKLDDRGVTKPFLLLNPDSLGLTDYCIFLSYNSSERNARKKIIDACVANKSIIYFAELAGEFQFTLSFFAKSIYEVNEFFDRLSALIPKSSLSMTFAVRTAWSLFDFTQDRTLKDRSYLKRGKSLEQVSLQSLDQKLLSSLFQNPRASFLQLSRDLSVSEITVKRHFDKLVNDGVLLGVPTYLDLSNSGYRNFRVLICIRRQEAEIFDQFFKFAINNIAVSEFVCCLGSWHIELNIQSVDPLSMATITQDLYNNLGEYINWTRVLNELNIHKLHVFDF